MISVVALTVKMYVRLSGIKRRTLDALRQKLDNGYIAP